MVTCLILIAPRTRQDSLTTLATKSTGKGENSTMMFVDSSFFSACLLAPPYFRGEADVMLCCVVGKEREEETQRSKTGARALHCGTEHKKERRVFWMKYVNESRSTKRKHLLLFTPY